MSSELCTSVYKLRRLLEAERCLQFFVVKMIVVQWHVLIVDMVAVGAHAERRFAISRVILLQSLYHFNPGVE